MQDELEKRIDSLQEMIFRLSEKVSSLELDLQLSRRRYVPRCPSCQREFDLLVNHYSIGLFDNLVYVKCPHCNKAMPVVDRGDGGIRLVTD